MATVWSFYFDEQSKKIGRTDASKYRWTLHLAQPGVLEVQCENPTDIATRLSRFGWHTLTRRRDDVVREADINEPAVAQDGTITDGSGIIDVLPPENKDSIGD
jgi:hypothetical protein